MFKLKTRIAEIAESPQSIHRLMAGLKGPKEANYFLGPGVSLALFAEKQQQWYILYVEKGDRQSFRISEANIVFQDTLAYSKTPIYGVRDPQISAIAKIGIEVE